MHRLMVVLLFDSALAVAAQAAAPPPDAERVRVAMDRFAAEPTVIEVQKASIRYFQVHPEALQSLRSRAHTRAAVPVFSGSYSYDTSNRDRDVDNPITLHTDDRILDRAHAPRVSMVWDTRDAIFNPSELDTYALVGMQLNILREVSRLYYIRQQVMLFLIASPPSDAQGALSLELRVAEYTALLDAYTGSWFSRELAGRAARKAPGGTP